MKYFLNTVRLITNVNKWVAFGTLVIMMVALTIFSFSRTFGHPFKGDIEVVQFFMVMLIVGSLAFTESTNSHISIGIIVDRLPALFQFIFDILSNLFVIVFCVLVCYVFMTKMDFNQASTLLRIPFFPFKMLLIIGFFSWSLEALAKLIQTFQKYKFTSNKGGV